MINHLENLQGSGTIEVVSPNKQNRTASIIGTGTLFTKYIRSGDCLITFDKRHFMYCWTVLHVVSDLELLVEYCAMPSDTKNLCYFIKIKKEII